MGNNNSRVLLLAAGLLGAPAFASTQQDTTNSDDVALFGAKTHYIEIRSDSKYLRTKVQNLGFAIDEVRSDRFFVAGNKKDAELLSALGVKTRVQEIPERWMSMDFGFDSPRYTSFPQAVEKMDRLVASHPSLLTKLSLGKSLENRDVPLIRISSRTLGQAETEQLPVVFFTGCHHAREHMSVEIPLRMIEWLAENYESNADVKRLLDTREVYIAPVINPDGHIYDYTDGRRGRSWRKNRRRNNDGSFGVDLNRNYAYQWGTGGSSTNPRSDTYMGTQPFSEPETQNVKFFVESQPRMTVLTTFHSFSELILYPWGHSYDKIGETRGNPADLPIFEKMARDMSRWNNYRPQQSSDLYIASGDTTDWAYGEHGIFSFTFELSPTSIWTGGFYPSPSTIAPTFRENIKPMLYMIEFADNPSRVLSERIPDFNTTPARSGIGVASFADVSM